MRSDIDGVSEVAVTSEVRTQEYRKERNDGFTQKGETFPNLLSPSVRRAADKTERPTSYRIMI